jgi:hypothetical protein
MRLLGDDGNDILTFFVRHGIDSSHDSVEYPKAEKDYQNSSWQAAGSQEHMAVYGQVFVSWLTGYPGEAGQG